MATLIRPFFLIILSVNSVSANAADLFAMTLEELLAVEIKVASKTQESLGDAPATVTVFTAEEIDRMGITNLDHLLNFIPGVFVSQEDTARSNVAVFRGRRINNYGPDVLIMVNGNRVNDPVVSGSLFVFPQMSLANVKQVEVIRGPGSAIYGSNAFSGVINVITEERKSKIEVRAGENRLKEGLFQFSHTFGVNKISGFFRDYRDNGDDFSPFFTFAGEKLPTRDPKRLKTAQLNLSLGGLTLRAGLGSHLFSDFIQGGIQGDGINQMKREARSYSATYDWQIAEDLAANISAEYLSSDQDELVLLMPAAVAATSLFGWTDGSSVDYIGGNKRKANSSRIGIDVTWLVHDRHKILYGLMFQKEKTGRNVFQGNWDAGLLESSDGAVLVPSTTGIQSGYFLPGGVRLDLLLPFERESYGVYIQDQFRITDALELTTGLRHDSYKDVGGSTSFRGGLVYQHSKGQFFKLLYGQAFRAPSIVDTNAEFSSSVVGNKNLNAEYVDTLDLVWQRNWTDLKVGATWFYSTVSDEIQVKIREPVPGFNALLPVNTGTRNLSGIELELDVQIGRSTLLRTSYSHFSKYQELGAAQNLFSASMNYNRGPWNWSINGFYRDKVLSREADGGDFVDDIYVADFWRFDTKFSYQINAQWQIYSKVENIFDEDYQSYVTSRGLPSGLPGRGRELSFGVWLSL